MSHHRRPVVTLSDAFRRPWEWQAYAVIVGASVLLGLLSVLVVMWVV